MILFEAHDDTSNKVLNSWHNIHINGFSDGVKGIESDYIYEEKYRNDDNIERKTIVVDLEHIDEQQ